jgi:hypothetical protein
MIGDIFTIVAIFGRTLNMISGRLLGQDGFPALFRETRNFKLSEKGHEVINAVPPRFLLSTDTDARPTASTISVSTLGT